jgi:hypothetical protein
MPYWLIVTIAVVFIVGLIGFFVLMFSEMGVKRKTGRMNPVAAAGTKSARTTRSAKPAGSRGFKTRPKKSR